MSDELNQNTEQQSQNELQDQNKSSETIKSNISPIAAAFVGLVGGFFLYQFVGGLLTLIVFGFDLDKAPINGLRLMTMAGQILFILLPALVFSKLIYEDVGKIIRLRIPEWTEIILFVVGIGILTPLLQSYLYIQNYYIEVWAKNSESINQLKTFFDSLNELVDKTYGNLLKASTIPELLLVVLVVAVVPAVSEEVMFRGFIQRSFEIKIKAFIAAFLTAVFFSLYHFNPYGLIPLAVLGLYFGFAAYTSKTLLIPILLHFLNNFTAVILYYIIGSEELIKSDVSAKSGEDLGFYSFVTIALSLVFVALIFLIKKYYSQKQIA
ncbi:MAG: CPBP family intramembrane metalloprotease [Ignavibacterium sp.]|uniref:CPBP family intramembrane glutamic endopeptidase n=1 Tax=Ignavibacterium album TaxID=591197 RepID=UPI0026ECF90C|nr:CPBP family intramembrane glutamic endopeptidase [Ignavibacterium album]MCA2004241.1 CPBP family intramembrane metalloprotease [Ignavibacterium sp.]MCX8104755.1 CPBP family intramembrane metalloprotease [Ignavibacterium album]